MEQQVNPLHTTAPELLEACRRAAIMCNKYADGAPDSPVFARECNLVGECLEAAIAKATCYHGCIWVENPMTTYMLHALAHSKQSGSQAKYAEMSDADFRDLQQFEEDCDF
jgi:hypothetical protein